MPWPEVEALIADGAFAVLPIGAASKQHRRHLPLATDYLQAQWITGHLVKCCKALVWPTLPFGHHPAFTDYPGSIRDRSSALRWPWTSQSPAG